MAVNPWVRASLVGAAAGLGATVVKSALEPRLQSLFEARYPPTPEQKELVGADPAGAPENMPPASVLRRAGTAATGSEPPEAVVSAGSQAIHLTFGTATGVIYTLAATAAPSVTLGGGVLAGLGLYGATHASTLPLLGVQPPPTSMPRAAVLWEATSHAIYGLTLEALRRLL